PISRADGGIGYLRLAENFAKRGDPGGSEIAKNAGNLYYLLDHNLAFVGSPKTVTEKIKAAAAEGLFNTVLGEFNIGDIAEEDLMRSIRLFGTGVVPALSCFERYEPASRGRSFFNRRERSPATLNESHPERMQNTIVRPASVLFLIILRRCTRSEHSRNTSDESSRT